MTSGWLYTQQTYPGLDGEPWGTQEDLAPVGERRAKVLLIARTEKSAQWSNADGNRPPHFTINFADKTVRQHISTNFAAYYLGELKNSSGEQIPKSPRRLNALGGRTIQVALLGVSKSTGWWNNESLDLLARVLVEICLANAISQTFPRSLRFTPSQPDNYRYRDEDSWGGTSGIVGVQHAPYKDGRWGPGDISAQQLQFLTNSMKAYVEARPPSGGPPGWSENGDLLDGDLGGSPGSDLSETSMDHLPFKFNPPLHKDLIPQRFDFSSPDPAGFLEDVYLDERSRDVSSTDVKALSGLRLGRLVQHEMASGMAAMNEYRYGFRFLYNPASLNTTSMRNNSVVINPSSSIGAVVSGIGQNFQVIGLSVLLNRTADVVGGKYDSDMYTPPLVGEDLDNLIKRGTEWDLEYLFRMVNGVFETTDRGKTGNIGVIIPSNLRLILGPGKSFFGFLESVSYTHKQFSGNMVPVLTDVELKFRRHVDMTPEQLKNFNDRLTASSVTGNINYNDPDGGGSAPNGPGNTVGTSPSMSRYAQEYEQHAAQGTTHLYHWAHGGRYSVNRMCLANVQSVWKSIGGRNIMNGKETASAARMGRQMHSKGLLNSNITLAPRGAILFWNSPVGGSYGHVAVADGHGHMLNNWGSTRITKEQIYTREGVLGWSTPEFVFEERWAG